MLLSPHAPLILPDPALLLFVLGALERVLFGGWDGPLTALLALCVLDLVLGRAVVTFGGPPPAHTLSRGVARKVGLFLLIAAAHLSDVAFGQPGVLRAAVICWFAATELLSITDHAARLGLPVPPALTGVIAALRVRGGDTPRDRDAN